MILEIPSPAEQTEAGLNLLNLAWTTGVTLFRDLRSDEMLTELEGLTAEYWRRAHPALTNGLAVIDQALEALLKARIADVSPYLLVDRRDFQKCAVTDESFAKLRTVGGSELFALHNAIAPVRLPQAFDKFFKDIRSKRNVIMHQPSLSAAVMVDELFIHVVRSFEFLLQNERWLDVRLKHLGSHPLTLPWTGAIYAALEDEMLLLSETLRAKTLHSCFGFEKSSAVYQCPNCDGHLAQLRPDNTTSTTLYCVVCGKKSLIVRRKCIDDKCASDVEVPLSGIPEGGKCLKCGILNAAATKEARRFNPERQK